MYFIVGGVVGVFYVLHKWLPIMKSRKQLFCSGCILPCFIIFRSGTLLILFFFLLGTSPKSTRVRHFKSDWDEIWLDCSASKYALIDGVTFLLWRHNFKMAAMTSFDGIKVLPSGECTHSVCPAPMQQRPPVPDLYIVHSCLLWL